MSTQSPHPDLVSEGCWGKEAACKGPDKAQGPGVSNVIKSGALEDCLEPEIRRGGPLSDCRVKVQCGQVLSYPSISA